MGTKQFFHVKDLIVEYIVPTFQHL